MANKYWWEDDALVFADGKYIFCDECPCTGTGTGTGTGTATGTILDCGICPGETTPSGMIIEFSGIRKDPDGSSDYWCEESDLGSASGWFNYCHHLDGSYDVPNQKGYSSDWNGCSGSIRNDYCLDQYGDQVRFSIKWEFLDDAGQIVLGVSLGINKETQRFQSAYYEVNVDTCDLESKLVPYLTHSGNHVFCKLDDITIHATSYY